MKKLNLGNFGVKELNASEIMEKKEGWGMMLEDMV